MLRPFLYIRSNRKLHIFKDICFKLPDVCSGESIFPFFTGFHLDIVGCTNQKFFFEYWNASSYHIKEISLLGKWCTWPSVTSIPNYTGNLGILAWTWSLYIPIHIYMTWISNNFICLLWKNVGRYRKFIKRGDLRFKGITGEYKK